MNLDKVLVGFFGADYYEKYDIEEKLILKTTNTILVIGDKIYHPPDIDYSKEIRAIELPEINILPEEPPVIEFYNP